MVQAKTSDFQPLPLKILNVLSLLAGASLLVAVSWEILLGDPRHYSTDYLLLQGIVCVVFLADFFARMWMADHSWRFFFRNLYFFLLSVPYLNIRRLDGDRTFACGSDADGTRTSFAGFAGAVCAFHLDHQ